MTDTSRDDGGQAGHGIMKTIRSKESGNIVKLTDSAARNAVASGDWEYTSGDGRIVWAFLLVAFGLLAVVGYAFETGLAQFICRE